MSVIIFIIVVVALIVVHEAGHFFVAKWSGMKVEEFGIGYPPRAAGFTYKETDYTLNWLPASEDRWKIRSRTFQGIADAMAEQWGSL